MNFKNKNLHLILGLVYTILLSYCIYVGKTEHNKGLVIISILFIAAPFVHFRKYFLAAKKEGAKSGGSSVHVWIELFAVLLEIF